MGGLGDRHAAGPGGAPFVLSWGAIRELLSAGFAVAIRFFCVGFTEQTAKGLLNTTTVPWPAILGVLAAICLAAVAIVLAGAPAVGVHVLKAYQKERQTTFINPPRV